MSLDINWELYKTFYKVAKYSSFKNYILTITGRFAMILVSNKKQSRTSQKTGCIPGKKIPFDRQESTNLLYHRFCEHGK